MPLRFPRLLCTSFLLFNLFVRAEEPKAETPAAKPTQEPALAPEKAEDTGQWETMDAVKDLHTGASSLNAPYTGNGNDLGGIDIFPINRLQQRPSPISQALPAYPFALRKAGIEGEVIVEFIVNEKGDVVAPFAVRSTDPRFDSAAVSAVAKWKFHPGKVDRQAVATRMQVPIIFALNATDPGPSGSFDADAATLAQIEKARKAFPLTKPEIKVSPRSQSRPVYPFLLRKANIEGQVIVDFIVDKNGGVQTAFAKHSTHRGFEKPAVDAVSKWRFTPATAKGKPVNMHLQVPVVFSLNETIPLFYPDAATILKIEAARKAFPVDEPTEGPVSIKQAAPEFPESLVKSGIEGIVVVDFIIDHDGNVQTPFILVSSNRLLEAPALAAAAQWKFRAARKDGKTVNCRLIVPIVLQTKTATPPVDKK